MGYGLCAVGEELKPTQPQGSLGCMTAQPAGHQTVHLWYARPVFFVADVNRAARFYLDMLGFQEEMA